MKFLIVVAHPDDEVLGCGAYIYQHTKTGDEVAVATLCQAANARKGLSASLAEEQAEVMRYLGVKKTYSADFPNVRMNTVPHLELVQFVEGCIADFGADIIITHHPSDMNNDHVMTSKATQVASRLFQRKPEVPRLKELMFMEVMSSTEWSFDPPAERFMPTHFVEVFEEGLEAKLRALEMYKGVMRDYPHPRSAEALRGLAAYRGAQAGCEYAEAFQCVFFRT